MDSKVSLALSLIGIASVLMLILAPITANQTFGAYYGKHVSYGKYGKHGRVCVTKVIRGNHGSVKKKVCYRR